jgi:arginyl-tRNA synthetase
LNQARAWNSLYFVRHIFQVTLVLAAFTAFSIPAVAANKDSGSTPQVKICELLTASSGARGISAVKLKLAEFISSNSALDKAFALSTLEAPKNPAHGDFSIPVFGLAKAEKKNPVEIAAALAEKLNSMKPAYIAGFEAVGGFLNIRIAPEMVQDQLHESYSAKGAQFGSAEWAQGKRVVIDYVSPNLAKPLHIGHFRASVIGQSIRNLAQTQGFEVVGLNHLGDWGIQFGYLIWGYQQWASEYDFKNKPFDSLYQLYVRVKKEAQPGTELETGGREVFRKMEAGDKEVLAIWEMFREITMTENNKVLAALNIQHDLVLGESFYNDKLKYLEDRLRKLSLLTESDGALGVCVNDNRFCLLRTSAGTSVYAARDLASALYRHEELKADEILYVVGNEQRDHFKLVFEVLGKMGETWVKDSHHIGFGLYLNNGKKISSRDGGTLTIDELIATATERALKIEPDPARARKLAMAALIFTDLSTERNGDVDFDWERVLNMEGGGPAIMASIERASKALSERGGEEANAFSTALNAKEEVELARLLLEYQEVTTQSYVTYQPSILAQYLYRVARAYNAFAQTQMLAKDAQDQSRLASQMYLTRIARDVMAGGLKILNIEPY